MQKLNWLVKAFYVLLSKEIAMIKANELRIGNYINRKLYFGKCGQPELIKTKINSGSFIDFCEEFEAIPLTPEILESCGFELYDGNTKHWIHPTNMLFDLFNITALEDGFRIIAGRLKDKVIVGSSIQIKYLHQLQNLFFAITGEELEIKELVTTHSER